MCIVKESHDSCKRLGLKKDARWVKQRLTWIEGGE
jgi:hypothetical protein